MFDIVPSPGPQSQVLNPAEASVFVQSSVPSTRFAIATPYKYLLPYSSTKSSHRNSHAPATGARHPLQCSQGCAQHTTPSSRSEDRRKGSLAPAITLITNFYMWWQLQASQDYHNMDSHTQISLIVTIASNNSIFK